MPTEIYMRVEHPDDGVITEECCSKESIGAFFKENHDEECLVIGYDHRVSVPTSKVSGQVTGTRKHEYLVITKLIDKASPELLKAVTHPSELGVEISFYRTPDETSAGEMVHYYTITLERAKVVSVDYCSPNIIDPRNDDYVPYEKVNFTYGKINVTHELCTTTHDDDSAEKG